MARIISVHEYELKPGSDPERLEQVFREAEARGLFGLPGLVAHHFVKGVKGVRHGAYAAVWVYESREAWERLWGTRERPRRLDDYAASWRIWEDQLLAPLSQFADLLGAGAKSTWIVRWRGPSSSTNTMRWN